MSEVFDSLVNVHPGNTDYIHPHGTPHGVRENMVSQSMPDYREESEDLNIEPVKVSGATKKVVADTATYRTVTLNTNNPFSLIVPQDDDRYRATLIASNANIYLCENRDLAMAVNGGNTGAGALIPSSVSVILENQWEVYAVNSVPNTPATVTVIVERYVKC